MFLAFGMPTPPSDFYMMENEILESATQTLKDVFLDLDINFALPQPFLLSDEYGQTRNFFTYENAETEQFWFHSDLTLTVHSTSLVSSNDANVFAL